MSTDKFEQWAIVEIMGHQKFAGYLTEQTIAGAGMLRLDVPAVGDLLGFTRLFNTASVYSITPTSEELARQVATALKRQPVTVYELPEEIRAAIRAPRLTDHKSGVRADPEAGTYDFKGDDDDRDF